MHLLVLSLWLFCLAPGTAKPFQVQRHWAIGLSLSVANNVFATANCLGKMRPLETEIFRVPFHGNSAAVLELLLFITHFCLHPLPYELVTVLPAQTVKLLSCVSRKVRKHTPATTCATVVISMGCHIILLFTGKISKSELLCAHTFVPCTLQRSILQISARFFFFLFCSKLSCML